MSLTPQEKEKLREEFVNRFPDMECSSEVGTAIVVANYWLKVIEEREKTLVDSRKVITEL